MIIKFNHLTLLNTIIQKENNNTKWQADIQIILTFLHEIVKKLSKNEKSSSKKIV